MTIARTRTTPTSTSSIGVISASSPTSVRLRRTIRYSETPAAAGTAYHLAPGVLNPARLPCRHHHRPDLAGDAVWPTPK
jgi:hypothetical protein